MSQRLPTRTGPYKPAPHEFQGFFIASQDRAAITSTLNRAAQYLRADGHKLTADEVDDITREIALSAELPSMEERTIAERNKLNNG